MSGHAHRAGRCRDLAAEISDYLDGDLSEARVAILEQHLARCACCTGFAASLRWAILACRATGQPRLPADVKQRARARIATIMKGARRTGR